MPLAKGFEGFVSFLDHHQGAVSIMFAAVVTLATVAYVVLTWQLVRETRLLRRFESEPNISIFLTSEPEAPDFLVLVISNTGRVAAEDIKFRFEDEETVLKEELKARQLLVLPELPLFRDGIKALVPSQEIRSSFGPVFQALRGAPLTPIQIKIFFKYGGAEEKTVTAVLTFHQFEGLRFRSQQSSEDSLKKIAETLESVVGTTFSPSRNQVYGATVPQAYLEEKRHAELRAERPDFEPVGPIPDKKREKTRYCALVSFVTYQVKGIGGRLKK